MSNLNAAWPAAARTEASHRGTAPLPRRAPAASFADGEQGSPPAQTAPRLVQAAGAALQHELSALRQRVPGIRGCVLATVDGLLVGQDLAWGCEPHDMAVLAASVFGVGRQCGLGLRQGAFRETSVRSDLGCFTVYAVTDAALLAVLSDDGLDLGWLHREARPVAGRIAELLPPPR
ncbi:roadblock/LC7 domain-containing protein [Plantactinospora sp. KBS50]|uniref:roadblock/LC7 domain-containing protein n=1 Tax=Plantactinospora sp. KBS50 TaxID=2024580 RepID=UPI001E4AC6B8|nr:roadblock/LC7 domain-containing protein [Plantactinospora sp. KBS50]